MALEIKPLLSELKAGLQSLYGDRLRGLYLFGSYARGTAEPDSDVDVLIVLDEIASYGGEIRRTGDLTSSVSLKFGVSVSVVLMSVTDWEHGENPFLLNVRDEAVAA
jgi:predicted nucleotidyltransferase